MPNTCAAARLGATWLGQPGCRFLVWAPRAERVELHLTAPVDRLVEMAALADGYFEALVADAAPGARYFYRLDGHIDRPDPASRLQPEGVHGPSQVIDDAFAWTDAAWIGLPWALAIFYELHVGAFTPEGTLDAVIPHLDGLVDLGVTALELLPLNAFPGRRNWGYDGAYQFAVQESYGGPAALKRLVDACHARGLAVCLDVVYNHLGPEGNYLAEFGPYFTGRYQTPWGEAVNFDGRGSDHVRRYFFENAVSWIRDYHIDMLRLDSVHSIFDNTARQVLAELAAAVHDEGLRLGRRVQVISETSKNDTRHVLPGEIGGYAHDALWNNDFHHALHAYLTGERTGYYADFGSLADLAKAYREGFALTGQYSHYRGRRHGHSSLSVPAERFVVYIQNHDQVGNRLASERLSRLVSWDELKLAAGLLLLSPYVPLLFMGEEYGETAPFPFFTDHGDPALNAAVWQGRQREFAEFQWQGEIPAPHNEDTFRRALLNRRLLDEPRHRELYELYRALIRLRKTIPALATFAKEQMEVSLLEADETIVCRRWHEASEVAAVFHFGRVAREVCVPLPAGHWSGLLASSSDDERSYDVETAGAVWLSLPISSFLLLQRMPAAPGSTYRGYGDQR